MKNKQKVILLMSLLGVASTLSGCAAALLPLASSLIPSVDITNVNVNTNEINCYKGGFFSSDYCSIPISKFVSLASGYTNPLGTKLIFNSPSQTSLARYDFQNHAVIDQLNKIFLANYPAAKTFAKLPQSEQSLYIKMHERYIPNKDYHNLYNSYLYLYTLSIIDFASQPCDADTFKNSGVSIETFALYKAFSIQFANNILYSIYGDVDGSHDNEIDLYNDVYSSILKIDPNKLNAMIQNIDSETNTFVPKSDWKDIFNDSGLSFGEIGTFSCTEKGNYLYRYGYQLFGTHVQGIDLRIKYKLTDKLQQY